MYAYAERLDRGDLDGVADLFAHAAFGREGDDRRREGREQVRQMYDAVVLYDDGTPRTHHLITNVTIDVAPDGATAASRCGFTVVQGAAPGSSIDVILSGTYHDRFERGPDGWRFRERVVAPHLIGDLSRHYRRP